MCQDDLDSWKSGVKIVWKKRELEDTGRRIFGPKYILGNSSCETDYDTNTTLGI